MLFKASARPAKTRQKPVFCSPKKPKNEKPKNKVVSPPKNVENNDFQYFLLVSGLTKNVNINHLKEIFANFGKIKNIEFPF